MLTITIPARELFDEKTEQFVYTKEQTLQLEHSLVSLSKWESKWKKPFFATKEKTNEETIDYIRCMTITQNVDPMIYNFLTDENLSAIHDYIEDPMTATTFSDSKNGKKNREIITAELIYYWMISSGIPFECQKWHLNKLITLIRVFEVKNTPPKKMSQRELMNRNRALNEARRKQFNSKG